MFPVGEVNPVSFVTVWSACVEPSSPVEVEVVVDPGAVVVELETVSVTVDVSSDPPQAASVSAEARTATATVSVFAEPLIDGSLAAHRDLAVDPGHHRAKVSTDLLDLLALG